MKHSVPRFVPALALMLCASLCILVTRASAQVDSCQVQKLTASDGAGQDQFGVSVSLEGNRAVVGAWRHDSGAAYVYESPGAGWIEVAKLVPMDSSSDDFGLAVSLHGDRILVGAPRADGLATLSGAAYLFEPVAGSWGQLAKLVATDGAQYDSLGNSVSLSAGVVVVGAPQSGDPTGAKPFPGAAYVFELTPFGWLQTTKLTASDGAAGDIFGFSVSVDGDRIAVGAWQHNNDKGAVYIFEKQSGAWVETTKLTASDGAIGDAFGRSVSLSGDRLLIGAPRDDTGSAYVFEDQGGSWVETAKLIVSPPAGYTVDSVAWSISLEDDRAALGDPFADGSSGSQGAGYAFKMEGGIWTQTATLTADDAAGGYQLGTSVSVSADRVLAGSPFADVLGLNDYGAAHVFELVPSGQPLLGCPGAVSLSFGGTQTLFIKPGAAFAGEFYILLGTASGTSPGFLFQGLLVPLNMDQYFEHTLANPNNPPLVSSLAPLDSAGEGKALFDIQAGTDPSFVGLTLNHAYVVFNLASQTALFVSNPEPVGLVP